MKTDQIQNTPRIEQHGQIIAGSPPLTAPAGEAAPAQDRLDISSPQPTAMEVFIAWEKLRLLYNAVLAGLVIWFLNPFGAALVIPLLAVDALLANLGFCAGPVAEGYLCLLGFPRKLTRWIVFGIGTALTVAQAVPVLQVLVQRLDR